MPTISERTACRLLRVSRAALHRPPKGKQACAKLSEELVAKLEPPIQAYPTYEFRRLWALLRFRDGQIHNRKAVYRALRLKRWLVHQRAGTPRPRVQARRSRTTQSHHRWAMDVTHIPCGRDGWGHLTAVIDCHDRESMRYEFALRGRAKEAERALEAACLSRFGTLRPVGATPVLRSDNGLIFQSRRFRQVCRDYRVAQECITPYTPQKNGLIERFFRSLKEECVWQYQFGSFEEAQQRIHGWMQWYNEERPHQAL